MNVLIVINDLDSGGAQKSLSSFLNALVESKKISDYKIDLMVSDKKGIFLHDIPKEVNVFQPGKAFKWMNCPLNKIRFGKDFSIAGIIGKSATLFRQKCGLYKKGLGKSAFWETWKKIISRNKKKYDVAIAYMDGWPKYYVMDKVDARRKVLWIHNEYQKLGYSANYDKKYFSQCDRIITISDRCRDSFVEVFPKLADKIEILENITLSKDIKKKAKEGVAKEFQKMPDKVKLVSVGRLSRQKAFDLAIRSAKVLKERGIEFRWMILGEGPDREKLEQLIEELQLKDDVFLIGVRSNPYPYIHACDVFVQTSVFEGKSIVLDEAKILAKPIVVTNYDTVYDTITDGETGVIVRMNADAVAEGILSIVENEGLKRKIIDNLSNLYNGNEKELEKYIFFML